MARCPKKVHNFVHRSDRFVLSKTCVKIQVKIVNLWATCANCLQKCDSKFDRHNRVPEKVNLFFNELFARLKQFNFKRSFDLSGQEVNQDRLLATDKKSCLGYTHFLVWQYSVY